MNRPMTGAIADLDNHHLSTDGNLISCLRAREERK